MNTHTYWIEQNWRSSVIPSNYEDKQNTLIIWLLFYSSLAICTYVFAINKAELLAHYFSRNYYEMTILFGALIPSFLLIFAVIKMRGNVDFGDTPLQMNPFPAIVGDVFLGKIDITKNAEDHQFFAELILHTYIKNERAIANGKSEEEATTKTIWKMPVTANKKQSKENIRLSLEARLPDNAPPSSPSIDDEYHEWQLHVFSADRRFTRTWDIPIVHQKTIGIER
jgi:hypothetical protein